MAWDGLWALPRTCLCWCLASRCSALSYTSLHSTGSSQFVSITAFGNEGEAPGAGLWNSCLRSQGLQASSHLFTGKVWSETSERCSSLRPLSYLSPDKWVICGEGCLDLSPSSVVLPWMLTVPLLRSCLCSPLLNSGYVASQQLLILQSLPKLGNKNAVIFPLNENCYDWGKEW